MQPLTAGELSLVEEIMSGKFHIRSVKKAKALSERAASVYQKKGKRKRLTLLDTRVVDDRAIAKISVAKAASAPSLTLAGTPPASTFVHPSLAKFANKTWSKLSESERMLIVTLLTDGSAYSNPSFVKEVTESLLLLADRKRLNDIGPVQSAE